MNVVIDSHRTRKCIEAVEKLGSGSKLCLDLEVRSLMKQSLDTLGEQDERCDMQTGTNQAMLTSGLTAGQIRQLFRRCPPL